jgi:Trk K+ transport system NAD-binding subunit
LFDAATETTVIVFAVISVLVMPLLFNALLPFRIKEVIQYMMLVGVNETSIKVAQELRAYGDVAKFVEGDPERVEQAQTAGFPVIENQATPEGLDGLEFTSVKAVLILSEVDELNLALARRAKEMGAQNVIALVNDPAFLPDFQEIGVKPYTSAIQRVSMITMMARNPDALALLTSRTDERDITVVSLRNPSIVGRRLRNLGLPGDFLVLAVRRNGNLLIPHGSTVLEPGDRLTILGSCDDLRKVKRWMEGQLGSLA